MNAVWALCFVQLWAVAADVLYVQPRRRLKAALERRSYAPGALSFALHASLPIVVVLLLVRAFVVDVFHIPSESMVPALQPGDRIWANRIAYGLRWPLSGEPLTRSALPRRGEVVVFRNPRDPATVFVKRVLGLPGDRVEVRDRFVVLNGQPLLQPWPPGLDAADQTLELDGTRFVWRADFAHPAPPVALELVVAEGHLFVVGDNLDHSDDSRHWGLVADRHLIGRAK
jgi:signal peptidase I